MKLKIQNSKDQNVELVAWLAEQGVGLGLRAMSDVIGGRRKFACGECRGAVYQYNNRAIAFIQTPGATVKVTGPFRDVDNAATQALRHGRKQLALATLYANQPLEKGVPHAVRS